jgi:2-polyprenyl-6-methoxyphenol hydroxylase-like FAD-dependent oxidoreductase
MAVLISGAGIAGLTTALSLHQIGVESRVFESVEAIEPLSVGFNTLPHAVRELTELGLAQTLAATAIPTAEWPITRSTVSSSGRSRGDEPRATTGPNSRSTVASCR